MRWRCLEDSLLSPPCRAGREVKSSAMLLVRSDWLVASALPSVLERVLMLLVAVLLHSCRRVPSFSP